jgi:hypothetical protein
MSIRSTRALLTVAASGRVFSPVFYIEGDSIVTSVLVKFGCRDVEYSLLMVTWFGVVHTDNFTSWILRRYLTSTRLRPLVITYNCRTYYALVIGSSHIIIFHILSIYVADVTGAQGYSVCTLQHLCGRLPSHGNSRYDSNERRVQVQTENPRSGHISCPPGLHPYIDERSQKLAFSRTGQSSIGVGVRKLLSFPSCHVWLALA